MPEFQPDKPGNEDSPPLTVRNGSHAMVPSESHFPATWNGSAGPAGGQSLDPIALLRALQRRWLLALSLGTLVAGLVAAGTWFATDRFLPPLYNAFALLQVHAQQPRLVFHTADRQDEGTRYQITQLVLIKSPFVLNRAFGTPGIAQKEMFRDKPDPAGWMAKELNTAYMQGSDVLRISLNGKNPNDAADVVKAVTDAYMQEVVYVDRAKRVEKIASLEKTLSDYEEKMRVKRENLRKLVENLKTADPQALTLRERIELQDYEARRQEKTRVDLELLRLQSQASVEEAKVKSTSEFEIPDALVEKTIESDPVIQEFRVSIAQAEQRLERMRGSVKADSARIPSSVTQAERELQGIKEKLEARRVEMVPETMELLREKTKQDSELALNEIRGRIAQVVEEGKLLDEAVLRYAGAADRTGTSAAELEALRYEISRADHVADQISNQLEGLRVEINSPARVEVVQPAEVPIIPDSSRHTKFTAMAGIASFLLVLACVAFLEYRLHRVTTADEVSAKLGIRVVGSLPSISHKHADAAERSHWSGQLTESIDSIRSMLLYDSGVDAIRSIMITSAMGGEGKTTLSSHLATSLARAGRRTLLIDSDLRRPAVHRVFDVALGGGLSDVLCGDVELSQGIIPSHVENLSLMTAGDGDVRTALEAIAKGRAQAIFDQLLRDFDFVIVDCPPVLPVADCLVLGQCVDAAIISLLHGTSQLPQVYAACARLKMVGVRVLGAVFGRARRDASGYSYRYGQYGYSSSTVENADE